MARPVVLLFFTLFFYEIRILVVTCNFIECLILKRSFLPSFILSSVKLDDPSYCRRNK